MERYGSRAISLVSLASNHTPCSLSAPGTGDGMNSGDRGEEEEEEEERKRGYGGNGRSREKGRGHERRSAHLKVCCTKSI